MQGDVTLQFQHTQLSIHFKKIIGGIEMVTKIVEINDLFWSGHKNRNLSIQILAIKNEIYRHSSPLQTIQVALSNSFYMNIFYISGIQHFREAMNQQESKPSKYNAGYCFCLHKRNGMRSM